MYQIVMLYLVSLTFAGKFSLPDHHWGVRVEYLSEDGVQNAIHSVKFYKDVRQILKIFSNAFLLKGSFVFGFVFHRGKLVYKYSEFNLSLIKITSWFRTNDDPVYLKS